MNNQPGKHLRGDALRHEVLNTALHLFSARGYFNTSIHDIRREAGVSIGAIYHHFQNKEKLAEALYTELMHRMEQAVADAIQKHDQCRDRCSSIITALFDLTSNEPEMMELVLMAKHREFLPEMTPICSSRPFLLMRQAVADGIEQGQVRPMDPWIAATAMFGGALRMMILQIDGALERPLIEYLDEVVDCGWRAVRG